MEFKLEGLDAPLVLPDEYLTVAQVEQGYRALVTDGKTQFDISDPATGRMLTQAIVGDSVDLASLPASPANMKQLFSMYGLVGELFAKSMNMGDDIIQEVEAKKDESVETPKKPVKRKSKRSQS